MKAACIVILIGTLGLASCGQDHDIAASASNSRLDEIRDVAAAGPYSPNWKSLATYTVPEWYKDAKFGIFIHWGVYSVPAFNGEWYPRRMYNPSYENGIYYRHHVQEYGPLDEFGYKDFIPLFTAEKFDADEWMDIFRAAGAKYVIPVAEHHDGFAMYDSAYSEWTAAKMGPKRDVIGELKDAADRADLIFGLSSHRAEHWWFFGHGRDIDSDVQDERYREFYGPAMDREESEAGVTPPSDAFMDDWLLRSTELIDKYEPQIVWFDWWMAIEPFHQHVKEFSAYYYNRGSRWDDMVAVNYKKIGGESYPDSAGVLDIERGQLADIRERFWQTDTSISRNSWGYIKNHDYKTAATLVDDLIDIVSKNGTLLLNIGPKPNGKIPEREVEILTEIGDWLALNGEAIYGTRPWVVYGEGVTNPEDGTMTNNAESNRQDFVAEDVRFTQKKGVLYAILMDWPGDEERIRIRSITPEQFSTEIGSVSMIGSTEKLVWERDDDGLSVTLPSSAPGRFAYVLKIQPAE